MCLVWGHARWPLPAFGIGVGSCRHNQRELQGEAVTFILCNMADSKSL